MTIRILAGTMLALVCASTHGADDDIRQSVIDRCRALMGEYGASMVKVCVDEDLAAYSALQSYDDFHKPVIDRCANDMLSLGGWNIVKVCADEDIEAERALENY